MYLATATFSDRTDARRALSALTEAHFEPRRMRVARPGTQIGHGRRLQFTPATARPARRGALLGALLGGLAALATLAGALVFPLAPSLSPTLQAVAWLTLMPMVFAFGGSIVGLGRRRVNFPVADPNAPVELRVEVSPHRVHEACDLMNDTGGSWPAVFDAQRVA